MHGGIKMNVVTKKKLISSTVDTISIFCTLTALCCVMLKLKSISIDKNQIGILAARSVFSRQKSFFGVPMNLNRKNENNNTYDTSDPNNKNRESQADPQKSDMPLPEVTEQKQENSHEGQAHKIIETQIGNAGVKCGNFYIKNAANQNIDFGAELNKKPEINITKTDKPQVLIFHTHTSESYMNEDTGVFYDSFYPRTLDGSKNVTRVGQEITDKLIKNGINAIHDTTYHDSPTYNGSYSRAAKTIKSNLEKYPSIQVVIDIHRDSMGTNETGKIKPTFKYQNKKAAQMMIISGCDPDGSIGFPNWNKNLKLALRLQKYAETMFPGITRPLKLANVKYNQHLTPGSMLIEVGSDVNTLEEAIYTGSMIGESLSKLLTDLQN